MSDFLAGLKNIIMGKVVGTALGSADIASNVTQYLGMDNKYEAGTDALEVMQQAIAGKISTEATIGGLMGATTDWLVTEKLKDAGLPGPLATALGEAAQALVEKLSTNLTHKGLEMMSDSKVSDVIGANIGALQAKMNPNHAPAVDVKSSELQSSQAVGTRTAGVAIGAPGGGH